MRLWPPGFGPLYYSMDFLLKPCAHMRSDAPQLHWCHSHSQTKRVYAKLHNQWVLVAKKWWPKVGGFIPPKTLQNLWAPGPRREFAKYWENSQACVFVQKCYWAKQVYKITFRYTRCHKKHILQVSWDVHLVVQQNRWYDRAQYNKSSIHGFPVIQGSTQSSDTLLRVTDY